MSYRACQKKNDEHDQPRRQALPEHERIAVVERAPCRDGRLRPHRAVLEFVRELDDIAVALRRIDVERLADHSIQPGRQVGAIAGEGNGLAEARPREWLDLTKRGGGRERTGHGGAEGIGEGRVRESAALSQKGWGGVTARDAVTPRA